jgi:hypothetical protein
VHVCGGGGGGQSFIIQSGTSIEKVFVENVSFNEMSGHQKKEREREFCTLKRDPFVGKGLGPYSKHFIFLLTYEWSMKARVLQYTRLQRANTLAYWAHW